MANLPLAGVRIIDMTVVWAGPVGSWMLASLGAELIRVESIHHIAAGLRGSPAWPTQSYLERTNLHYGYPDRVGGVRPFNRYYVFNWYQRNVKSFTVDLRRPEGRDVLLRLAKVSDGLIENQAARNMENLGIDYPDLSAVNPKFIMVRMPGFGLTGPSKYRLGYGYTMDAISGHTSLRHYPDADPITQSVFHGDAVGAGMMASMFTMALHYRNRTGKGQLVEISQTENAQCTFGGAFMDYFMNGRVQGTIGNRDDSAAPQNVYLCKDYDDPLPDDHAWFVLTVENDDQWRRLCNVMGKPELAHDPRFADVISRKKNEALIDPLITEWAADKDQYEIMYLLQAEGIPAGPVIHHRDTLTDPHLVARDHWVSITHPETGPVVDGKATPGTHLTSEYPFKLSETPPRHGSAPCLGEHNEYVYKELLGYSDAEFQWFVDNKHAGLDYLPDAR